MLVGTVDIVTLSSDVAKVSMIEAAVEFKVSMVVTTVEFKVVVISFMALVKVSGDEFEHGISSLLHQVLRISRSITFFKSVSFFALAIFSTTFLSI